MILTPNILIRLVVLIVLGVVLQLTFFSRVAVLGVSPDILPALVVALGLLGGSMTGAVAGFSVGLLLDCLLIAPVGGSSLVLLATGYMAGLFRERFVIHSPLVPPLLCMALTLFAQLGFGAIEAVLGLEAQLSSQILRELALKSLYAFILGWPLYLGVKRLLRSAIVEEPEERPGKRPTVLGA